jgi:alpha-galactosidase
MKKFFFTLLFFVFLIISLQCQTNIIDKNAIKLDNGWKFITGDNIDYARQDFDDSQWKEIRVDKTWEGCGYGSYDGYAWYRIKIVIPSKLIKSAKLNDKVIFKMGKIDDVDQVYLNGQLIGENTVNVPAGNKGAEFKDINSSKWSVDRIYSLNENDPRILWDKENTIAVRVHDGGGDGGIYSGGLQITTMQLHEYFVLDYNRETFTFQEKAVKKNIWLLNTSDKHIINGKLNLLVKNEINGKKAFEKSYDIRLQPKQTQEISYSLPNNNQPNSVEYVVKLVDDESIIKVKEGTPYILTPAAGEKPSINGAKIYGQRTGKPFLYRIPATGIRPMKYFAVNLPEGLNLDEKTGIISGKVNMPGEYKVKLVAENSKGKCEREFKIVIGDKIALTPPMGWNSWNCWGLAVDQKKVIAAANAFVDKGLADYGWTYINIDDGWEIPSSSSLPKRDNDGNIIVNDKFPDMEKLGEDIHSLGLKFGIYSSPGESTCGGYTASYGYEEKDAESYARWGIDYLKYDWCSYDIIAKDKSLPELMKPYYVMREALNKIDRDIVYSLCQYGMGNVWEWGDKVGGNLWRTTGDITDTWKSLKTIGFSQVENVKFSKPGNWNDPDMLIVGKVGWGPNLHPTRLTPSEQYTHISLWALLSSPMLIGCDLENLDQFTFSLLSNNEVIALDQDPLGLQAVPVIKTDSIQVWVKELEDGQKAIGIFNLSEQTISYNLIFEKIGLKKSVGLRNLWTQKDIDEFKGDYKTFVSSHGVVLLKTK